MLLVVECKVLFGDICLNNSHDRMVFDGFRWFERNIWWYSNDKWLLCSANVDWNGKRQIIQQRSEYSSELIFKIFEPNSLIRRISKRYIFDGAEYQKKNFYKLVSIVTMVTSYRWTKNLRFLERKQIRRVGIETQRCTCGLHIIYPIKGILFSINFWGKFIYPMF